MYFTIKQTNSLLREFGHSQCLDDIPDEMTIWEYLTTLLDIIINLQTSEDIYNRLAKNYVITNSDIWEFQIKVGTKGFYFRPYDTYRFSLYYDGYNDNEVVYGNLKKVVENATSYAIRPYAILQRSIEELWKDVGMNPEKDPMLKENYVCPRGMHNFQNGICSICGAKDNS